MGIRSVVLLSIAMKHWLCESSLLWELVFLISQAVYFEPLMRGFVTAFVKIFVRVFVEVFVRVFVEVFVKGFV